MFDDDQQQAAGEAASRFLKTVLVDGELDAVWPDAHPVWRTQMVSDHLLAPERVEGFSAESRRIRLATRLPALAEDDGPSDARWWRFRGWLVKLLRAEMPNFEQWIRVDATWQGDAGVVVSFLNPKQSELETKLVPGGEVEALNVLMSPDGERWLFAGTV